MKTYKEYINENNQELLNSKVRKIFKDIKKSVNEYDITSFKDSLGTEIIMGFEQLESQKLPKTLSLMMKKWRERMKKEKDKVDLTLGYWEDIENIYGI